MESSASDSDFEKIEYDHAMEGTTDVTTSAPPPPPPQLQPSVDVGGLLDNAQGVGEEEVPLQGEDGDDAAPDATATHTDGEQADTVPSQAAQKLAAVVEEAVSCVWGHGQRVVAELGQTRIPKKELDAALQALKSPKLLVLVLVGMTLYWKNMATRGQRELMMMEARYREEVARGVALQRQLNETVENSKDLHSALEACRLARVREASGPSPPQGRTSSTSSSSTSTGRQHSKRGANWLLEGCLSSGAWAMDNCLFKLSPGPCSAEALHNLVEGVRSSEPHVRGVLESAAHKAKQGLQGIEGAVADKLLGVGNAMVDSLFSLLHGHDDEDGGHEEL